MGVDFIRRWPILLSYACGALVAIAFLVGFLTPFGIALWVVGLAALVWRLVIARQRGLANRPRP
jgi:hypothetical protein